MQALRSMSGGAEVQVARIVVDSLGMSLTSSLDDRKGPIAVFFSERIPNVRSLQREFRKRVAGRATIRPRAGSVAGVPWGTLGTAIDYRMRYYFAAYSVRDTVAFLGLGTLSPAAVLVALGSSNSQPLDPLLPDRWAKPFVDFLDSLDRAVAKANPVGRSLSRGAEDELNRHCYVLALLEQYYRVGRKVNSPILALPEESGVAELLALADPWLEDLRRLSQGFFRECQALLGREHVLNPTFAGSALIGGADADFIVERCLVEVKTTIDPVLRSLLLWQMLGYVLLDLDDRFRIDKVAVYMARQAMFLRWPLRTFMQEMASAPVDLAAVRRDFEDVLREAKLGLDPWDLVESGRMVRLSREGA